MSPDFAELLARYADSPESSDRKRIECELWDRFGAERAVFVLDMSGFSRLVERYGIVHYLSMIRRMQSTVRPIVRDFGGTVVKFEADNGFATFPDCTRAVRAATALTRALEAANASWPEEQWVRVSCGIDYGPILVVAERDFFGNAVNRASKLGEDIARAGEVLITEEVRARVADASGLIFVPESHSISQIEIRAYRVEAVREEFSSSRSAKRP